MKVKCIRHNVYTSKGKLAEGDTADIPKDEFDMICAMDGDNPRLQAKRGRPAKEKTDEDR